MLPWVRPLAGLCGITVSTGNPMMARCDKDNTQSLLISSQMRSVECGIVLGDRPRRTCPAACVDEYSFRMFLCALCRSQVLVCRRCDRGQIYCTQGCAHDARRDHQREARRRHQATPRGRAMHAERNRRYRARASRVTDQGPAHEPETGPWRGLQGSAAPSDPSSSASPSAPRRCHFCGRPAASFIRLSALRPRRRRGKKRRIMRGGPCPP
jgi:hypothetical protein